MSPTPSPELNVASRPRPEDRGPRVFYAAGPGNLIAAFRHWQQGDDDPNQVAVTYSGQFFEVCRQLGLEGMAVASQPTYERAEMIEDGAFRVGQVPIRWAQRSGLAYHLGEVGFVLRLIAMNLRFGSGVALIQGGFHHWYLFGLLRLFGVRVVPILMIVLWPKHRPPGRARRLLRGANGWFFRRAATAILSASEDISRQVREITADRPALILPFLPRFRPGQFEGLGPPAPSPPFRVLYAGRIERYKGVFDLLEIAGRFASAGRDDIEFDLCGDGPALAELRHQAESAGLTARFRTHGHCPQDVMCTMYERSHVVIAPTTSEFIEGFNQVVAEGVLSGRPVITSSVCPALEYVREAVVEVPPDDVDAYAGAILRLRDDPEFYAEKERSCPAVQDRILKSEQTFGEVLGRFLDSLLTPDPTHSPPDER